ncbi:Peptidyl-prolyl cis-trans isomerase fkbp8 [Bulinus truncatus]|nr:Peptidyl-prolyl cis-trans isomerase fkbp8 [Bulinus truncatus]
MQTREKINLQDIKMENALPVKTPEEVNEKVVEDADEKINSHLTNDKLETLSATNTEECENDKEMETVLNTVIESLTQQKSGDLPEQSSVLENIETETVSTPENDSRNEDFNEDCSSDSMPDLIWPEKKSKAPTDVRSALSSSTSQDTGFGSEDFGDTSPDEPTAIVDLSKKSSSNAVDNNTSQETEEENVMDILGNGLLIKKVLLRGKGIDTRPINGDIVTLKVEGKLEDGTLVENEEITFNLNDGDVILAFDLAAALMEEGEKCELTTDNKYAYGQLGREPDIPKDSKIIYTLELLSVEPAPELSSLTFDERLTIGEKKRERGNYLFARTDYTGAINSYNKAVKVLVDADLNAGLDKTSHSILTDSSVKCFNNMAACQLKIDAYDAAIRSCEKVLAAEGNNVKALYRIGKAYGAKGEIEQAIEFMRRAIKLDPESKMLNQEMLNLVRRKNKETATERELYKKMLGVKTNEKTSDKKTVKNSGSFIKWTVTAGVIAAALISVGVALFKSS